MKLNIFFLLLIIITSTFVFGQTKTFKIHNNTFTIKSEKVSNEWKTKDDLRKVYLNQQLVLMYYAYKDEGGDCNNLFWDKEWLNVKDNTIVIFTHHFQKRTDPITEWEKKIFMVSKNGQLKLIKHLYKKYGATDWKENEE